MPRFLAREPTEPPPRALSGRGGTEGPDRAGAPGDLLLSTITAAGPAARAAFGAWRRRVDLEAAVDPESMALLPLVYGALLKLGIDDPLMSRLKGVSRRIWYENSLLLEAAGRILSSLSAASIDHLVIGELPLAVGYYETLAARRIGQIEILVWPGQAERASAILSESDFAVGPPLRQEEIAYDHAKRFGGRHGPSIVLNWHALAAASNEAVDGFFWHSAEDDRLCGKPVRRLSRDGLLLQLLLGADMRQAAMPRLWVADALALAGGDGQAPGWTRLAGFALTHRLAGRMSRQLRLLSGHGLPVPDAVFGMLRGAALASPEVIDAVALGRSPGRTPPAILRRSAVVADYLRSGRRPGLTGWPGDFSHFVRHRWGLNGRRQLAAVIVRHLLGRRRQAAA